MASTDIFISTKVFVKVVVAMFYFLNILFVCVKCYKRKQYQIFHSSSFLFWQSSREIFLFPVFGMVEIRRHLNHGKKFDEKKSHFLLIILMV